MLPRPWHARWDKRGMVGLDYADHLTEDEQYEARQSVPNWRKFDLMTDYRWGWGGGNVFISHCMPSRAID